MVHWLSEDKFKCEVDVVEKRLLMECCCNCVCKMPFLGEKEWQSLIKPIYPNSHSKMES